MEDNLIETNETTNTQSEEKTVGKFFPKRKFLNFIQGRKGGVRFHTDTAFVKSEELTGTIEGAIFKITICDDGINFEETDTNFTDEKMIQRFIDDIDERDVTGYMQKFVVHGIDFRDQDNNRLFLEVEYKKPIDQLFSLFDDLKKEKEDMKEMEVELSNDAMSLLDNLFGDVKVEEVQESKDKSVEDVVAVPEVKETFAQQMMRESFEKMNLEKINELSDRIEKKEKDISKYKLDIKQAESNLKTASEDLGVLYTRLESLKPIDSPNGYIFYVSPENKTGIVPDQTLVDVIAKIAPILKLRESVVIDMLTKGYHTIKIATKGDIENNTDIKKDIYEKIRGIDVLGNIKFVAPGEIEYRGDLTWHKLVDKMIRLGFEQDPDFDKKCGSPSYESEFEDDKVDDQLDILNQQINSVVSNLPNLPTETNNNTSDFVGKTLMNITEPTTLVVVGEGDYSGCDVQITDDETSFALFVDGEKKSDYGSMGFIKIYTLDEFKKNYEENKEMYSDNEGLVGGFVLPNFVGEIKVSALLDNRDLGKVDDPNGKTFSDKFDISDYIQHQFDAYADVVISVNNTVVFDLNEDLSLPISMIRDIKIDKIIE